MINPTAIISFSVIVSPKNIIPANRTAKTEIADQITLVKPIEVYANDLAKHRQTAAYDPTAKSKYNLFSDR